MTEALPSPWREFLTGFIDESGLYDILSEVERRRDRETVFPPAGMVFNALKLTPPDKVRVVIIGQDPYHGEGQAEGLAFSVPEGVKPPPSLRNIFKEFSTDLGCPAPTSGHLGAWCSSGVLLLNTVLTVAARHPGSHRRLGWEKFTDAIISALNARHDALAFILWGNFAAGKSVMIDHSRHFILTSAHPSPLSASRGFFGSRPFSQVETSLGDWHWPR